MRSRPECIACSLRQALLNARQVTDDEDAQVRAMNAAMAYLSGAKLSDAPARISSWCARRACESLGVTDPFASEKARFNELALALVPELQSYVGQSTDKLRMGALLAAAGNIIDLGILTDIDVSGTAARAVETGFAVDHFADFSARLAAGASLLYIGDNAGEIVFDKLFISQLAAQGVATTFAVRSAPISNDATLTDAHAVGMQDVATLIETGSWEMGVPQDGCSAGFWSAFDRADIVISKGHANYETLDRPHPALFFLLTAKCSMVADELGVKLGDAVFVRAHA